MGWPLCCVHARVYTNLLMNEPMLHLMEGQEQSTYYTVQLPLVCCEVLVVSIIL